MVKPNLLKDYEGRLWEIPQGRHYLKCYIDYATALYNLQQKHQDAADIYEDLVKLDPLDHVVSSSIDNL